MKSLASRVKHIVDPCVCPDRAKVVRRMEISHEQDCSSYAAGQIEKRKLEVSVTFEIQFAILLFRPCVSKHLSPKYSPSTNTTSSVKQ